MQTTDALWKVYQALTRREYHYKVVIDDVDYLEDKLISIKTSAVICPSNALTIGNVVARKFSLSVRPTATPIPKMASAFLYVAMNGASGYTAWLPQGKFYVDTRVESEGRINLEAYDKVLMMEAPFIQTEVMADFPMLMIDALNIICTRLDIVLANPEAIRGDFYIEYPTDLTMRQVAGNIADAHCGNFVMDADGKLRLLILATGEPVATVSCKSFELTNRVIGYDLLTMYYDDTHGFQAGIGIVEFVDKNAWATQAIADHVISVLAPYQHRPFRASKAYMAPEIQLGDTITINGENVVVFSKTTTYGVDITHELNAPGETELTHEFPYQGSYAKEIKQKVTLGESYYGNTISRANGFKVARSDGNSEIVLNSDLISMRQKVNGVLTDVLYFDPIAKVFKITSNVFIENMASAGALAALEIALGQTGSTNLVHNSAARDDINGYEITGSVVATEYDALSDLTEGKGYFTVNGIMEQALKLTPGVEHVASIRHINSNACTVKLLGASEYSVFQSAVHETEWSKTTITFTPDTTDFLLQIVGFELLITDILVATGTSELWRQSANELISLGVKITPLGVSITQSTEETKTIIDATGNKVIDINTGEVVAAYTKYGTVAKTVQSDGQISAGATRFIPSTDTMMCVINDS